SPLAPPRRSPTAWSRPASRSSSTTPSSCCRCPPRSPCTPPAPPSTFSTRSTSTWPDPLSLDLDLVRERFESSTDFTVGLEEEFAILDPATLGLEHRFEDVYAACERDELLAESAAGELIAAEVEIRS